MEKLLSPASAIPASSSQPKKSLQPQTSPNNEPVCPYAKCAGDGIIIWEKDDRRGAYTCQCVKDAGKKRFLGDRFWKVQLTDTVPRSPMQKFLKDSLTSNPDKGVFLFGKGGSGKTHFLAAMYNYWESNGKKLKYFDDAGLKDELRNAELNNDYTFCYDLIRNYDGIFIDDAGKQQMTPFYQGGLYRVFNEAYKFKKYIFITSNDSLKALSAEECWGPHAARRVEDLCQVVEFA